MIKAYKPLKAYNFFLSGWVNTLHAKKIHENKTVIFARVGTKMFLRLKIVRKLIVSSIRPSRTF